MLFGGEDLSGWTKPNGDDPTWKVVDGAMHVQRGGGVISGKTFGDAQIHVEFSTPADVQGKGQGRGNSGVYVQGRYEVQVLDSFDNKTYPNGQCGAIYGHHAPLVNACRGPGAWQSYDIVFHAARFDDAGKKIQNATMTVFHNGVLIQDHADVPGSTTASPRKEGATDGPLYLQDHGNTVRYRNIWYRPL